MLSDLKPVATVAVKDLATALRFYGETLGLRREPGNEGEAITFSAGGMQLLVYRSSHAGTNRATSVTWMAGADVEGSVRDLQKRGVKFKSYDIPGMTRQGALHVAGGMKAAWFDDPDGNIHAIVGT